MLSEGYPLLVPLMAVGWNRVRSWSPAGLLAAGAGLWSVFYQIQGIATFDAITSLDPPNLPWQPSQNFLLVYIRQFGLPAAIKAFFLTLGLFGLVAVVAAYVFAPFFLPLPKPTRRIAV